MAGCGDGETEDPSNGNGSDAGDTTTAKTDPSTWPAFTLAPSEYPSWSVFMTAGKAGFINPKKGGDPGTIEKKYQVDIVLDVNDYDTCLQKYGAGAVDAVCITNTDQQMALFTVAARPGYEDLRAVLGEIFEGNMEALVGT